MQNSEVSCYADDTAIYCSASDVNVITRNLQEDLDLVAYWLKCNKLSLNTDKTKIMCFSTQYFRRDTTINIYINNTQLEQVMSYKYLGLILDTCSMKFSL